MDRVLPSLYMPKKKIAWKLFLAIFSPFIVLLVGLFFWGKEDKFSLDKIRPKTHFSLQFSQPNSLKELHEIRDIVSQPYLYLTESKDTYSFVSKDEKYIVKFFKTRRMTPKYWLNYIPLPWLDGKRLLKISERERIRDELFKSLKVSFELYRYQTGLVFLHLFRTNYLRIKMCVKDQNGVSHYVPLDEIPFVVQRKMTMLFDYINRLIKKGKEEKAVHSLCHILGLVKEGCTHGFIDLSDQIGDKYGFIGGRPVHVEGSFIFDESYKNSFMTLKEVFRVSRILERWVEENQPALFKRFQTEVQEILTVLEEE